jgi:hypothetical protein
VTTLPAPPVYPNMHVRFAITSIRFAITSTYSNLTASQNLPPGEYIARPIRLDRYADPEFDHDIEQLRAELTRLRKMGVLATIAARRDFRSRRQRRPLNPHRPSLVYDRPNYHALPRRER